jgi:enoyl-CoA hydratase/carnithine racemase
MTESPPQMLMREGAVARLRISRATADQTATRSMWRAIPGLVAQAEAAPSVMVLLLESDSPDVFCSGHDPGELAALCGNRDLARAVADEVQAAVAAVANTSKPSIALLRGNCVGGGLALALACDLRFANDTATLGMTQGQYGLLPSFAEARALATRVGLSRAADMMFSGRLLGASEAERIGLVDDVWRNDAFDAAIGEYVAALCSMSQYSVRGTKAMLRGIAAGVVGETAQARSMFEQAFTGEDFRAACSAFQDGGIPAFTWR